MVLELDIPEEELVEVRIRNFATMVRDARTKVKDQHATTIIESIAAVDSVVVDCT